MIQEQREKDAEDSRGNDTTLFHSTPDVEGFRHAALILDGCLHVIMKGSNQAMQLCGQPIFRRMLNSPSLLTRLKALVRSMKAMSRGLCCSLHFSCGCQREKIIIINCRAFGSEATLGFRVDTFSKLLKAHEHNPGIDFA